MHPLLDLRASAALPAASGRIKRSCSVLSADRIARQTATSAGIGEDFIKEVEGLMKPGMSALFVLDSEGDMDVILHSIRGLGGTVLKTNVDPERAKLIQWIPAFAEMTTRRIA